MAEEDRSLIPVFEAMQILPDPSEVQRYVRDLRASNPGATVDALAQSVADGTVWRMTGAGIVSSLPSVIPGLGTAVSLGIAVAGVTGETWLMFRNLAWLQLTVAGLYGHDLHHEDRKDELMIIWGLTAGLLVPTREVTKVVGEKVTVNLVNRYVTRDVLNYLNRMIGAYVFTRYGTQRGVIALGRVIPFGIGAAIGGGMNYASTRAFARSVVRFYNDQLPSGTSFTTES